MVKGHLTIIIPCKNEEGYIDKTLLSLNKQLGIDGTKVIILDANSTDNTIKIIKEIKKKLKYEISIETGGNVSYGRNKGVSLANTKYVLLLDADVTLVGNDVINKSLNEMFLGNELVTCKLKSRSGFPLSLGFILFNWVHKFLKEPFSIGAYFMTTKESFNKYGGFDETIKQSEDFILSKKYDRNKFKIINRYITQDDRRFKKMGYWFYVKLLITNYIKRNDENHFRKEINYFK
jgi:glycosyltransferase involved in cell wall biosynthesis